MAIPSSSPGNEAARVCLDILRGASQLAQPYAAHLSKAGARGQITISPPMAPTEDIQVSTVLVKRMSWEALALAKQEVLVGVR
jgi:hypothetical protein